MTGALLCPGPSLARLREPPRAGLTVAVNRAATLFRCDWWAAADLPLVETWGDSVRGDPLLFTKRDTRASLARRGSPWAACAARCCEDLACPVPRFDLFTAPAALVLMAVKGCRRIDVYGADWTPGPDFDGVAAGENRSAERWAVERGIWDAVVAWLADRASVERITDGQA
jgi:hypothetical protein